jgi:hypothetical protein
MIDTSLLAFDDPAYVEGLPWLGQPRRIAGVAAVERAFGASHHDLRGSWPYQTLPSSDRIVQVAAACNALSYTLVVRPDVEEAQIALELVAISNRFAMTHRVLKPHLAHLPDRTPVRQGYSGRTRMRLAEADTIFSVEREAIGPSHLILSEWQDRLAVLRQIPRISSPDAGHFESLVQAGMTNQLDISAITLKWKRSGTIAGIFLLLAGADRSWHGHSFLVEPEAIKNHGTYLLFDRTIAFLGDRPIWFGGAPAGPKGQGVFQFKERFSNASSPARIVSIDLDPQALERVRANVGTFPWLPNYRDPAQEISSVLSGPETTPDRSSPFAAAALSPETVTNG